MLTHSKDKQSMMYVCPVPSCGHRTLQKSNLATHIRTHTRAKPHKCPEYNSDGFQCDFSTADPSSLHRHRKRKHGYRPQSKQQQPRKKTRVADGCDSEEEVVAGPSKPRRPLRVQAEKENENENEEEDVPGEVLLMDPTAMAVDAQADFDLDEDGEGEPEDETEAVPLFVMPPHLESAPPSHIHPYLVLANISDTRTDVDGRHTRSPHC
ncbi:hypothetical protein FB45DRAFT_317155 [Roridomyces roridus]|uniref:C2H2-type domain-containing protein n=1 Tax=Roridomyces roridus TaxID=1738132 RepID=A0AAD7B647_9AGAR|nr:hypothetical protein FB45DRAFT_317155 [Roridomyces roridus]